ncbi:MAG: cyclic pyranopterin monophosphate synthase MoaC [Gemmatimonadota bacterium]
MADTESGSGARSARLTHVDAAGRPAMVDVGAKPVTARVAVAEGRIRLSPEAFELLGRGGGAKGDPLVVARLAGIGAAKQTAALIPLCHTLPLDHVDVALEPDAALPGVQVKATVRVTGRTGVEMEALTAVSVALLTVYDMLKAVDRGMVIEGVRLLRKAGGRSGEWEAGPVRGPA